LAAALGPLRDAAAPSRRLAPGATPVVGRRDPALHRHRPRRHRAVGRLPARVRAEPHRPDRRRPARARCRPPARQPGRRMAAPRARPRVDLRHALGLDRPMTPTKLVRDALVLLGIIACVTYWWYLTSTGGAPVDVHYYWAADPSNLYPHPELGEHNGYNYSPA